MKTLSLSLCLTSLLLGAARAEEKAPAPITLKHHSSFEGTDTRNPFWPIGWTRPDPKPGAVETGPALSPASFSLTSVTMGSGERFAILNGKIVQEGQQFGLQFGSQVYQVTVQAIQDGEVVLVYQGGQINVPLRRK